MFWNATLDYFKIPKIAVDDFDNMNSTNVAHFFYHCLDAIQYNTIQYPPGVAWKRMENILSHPFSIKPSFWILVLTCSQHWGLLRSLRTAWCTSIICNENKEWDRTFASLYRWLAQTWLAINQLFGRCDKSVLAWKDLKTTNTTEHKNVPQSTWTGNH